jgi:hypothetical protein
MVNNNEPNFINRSSEIRKEILDIENDIKIFKHDVITDQIELIKDVSDKGEILANLIIAYRHLEDARMRIGKAIQAYDGGISAYKR